MLETLTPSEALAMARVELGVNITKAVRWMGNPPKFSIWVDDLQIDLRGVENLTSQRRFRNMVFMAISKMPNKLSREKWDRLLNILGIAMEDR